MPEINEHPGILLYSRIRKSPYFYASRRHGVGLYSVYNHTYHPRHYGDPVEEYWQLLNGVTLWDVGVERQIEISGPDAFDFTNLLVARDLNKCQVEQCKYVFLCLPHGGIINDPVLLRVEENRFWLSLADSDVELWARGVARNSDYDVEIKELDVGPVQVQGPKSKDVMVDLFGESILEIPYYFLRPFELDGMKVLVSRTGYTAELGYEIYLYEATKNGVRLWDAVLEAGKPHDLAVIGPCHIRRIEGGILALGCDMWYDTNPYEVGMGYDWMVDLEQGADFIGKEALALIKREGPKRKLAGVEIGGDEIGSYNDGSMIDVFPVHSSGSRIGAVTSACYSPRLEKNIGYAMVPIEQSELGTELDVERPDGTVSATVVEMPFIDPKKETPKQELASSSVLSAAVHIRREPLDDERRGELIFAGDVVVFTRVAPVGEAARLIRAMADDLLTERALDPNAIAGVQDRFKRDPALAALLRAGLEAVGVDPARTYWDSPYLRVLPPADPAAERQIGRIGLHRDTWSSNIPQQTNWWMTVYPLVAERTIALLPGYWSRPLANTSADWDLDEIRSRRHAGESDEDLPIVPEPTEPVDTSSELRIVIEPGDLLCFSGAHLHGSVPNASERARVSVELRTVSGGDVDSGRGAPAIDGRAPRVPLDWFRSMSDGSPLSKEAVP